MSTRIETVRLVIRTFQARDVGPWLAMVTDPEVTRFLPPAPRSDRTMELAQRVIGERQAMERELGHAMWAVEDKMTGTFVGQCGLRPVDEGAGPEIDLAYHYTRASWNKGYGTEAAIAVLAHGLGPAGLDAIMAVVVPENAGSWRVMEKAGMRYGHATWQSRAMVTVRYPPSCMAALESPRRRCRTQIWMFCVPPPCS